MGFVIHWHKSAMDLHVSPILIPAPTSLSTRSLWVFPVHQARTPVPCMQPGRVICFTIDNIHVSMLFSLLFSNGCTTLSSDIYWLVSELLSQVLQSPCYFLSLLPMKMLLCRLYSYWWLVLNCLYFEIQRKSLWPSFVINIDYEFTF